MTATERNRLTGIYLSYVSGDITAVQAEQLAGMYLSQLCYVIRDQNDGGMF